MTRIERHRFIFLLFSGSLYFLMLILIPTKAGMGELLAIIIASVTLGTALISALLYFILLKRTTYVFLTELFTLIGIGLITLSILSFPYP